MGHTPQPLYLVVEEPLYNLPEFSKLREQGHIIIRLGDPAVEWEKANAIVGPRCWRMKEDLVKYLSLLLKEARAAKGKLTRARKVAT